MIITDENITFDRKEEKKKKEDLVDEQTFTTSQSIKNSIGRFGSSVRAFNCLKAAKINSLRNWLFNIGAGRFDEIRKLWTKIFK